MRALILSGGGALGAFQVGAEKYAREVKGYTWDVIAGVSIGALNGAMLAQGNYQRLYEVWSSEMSDRLVYGFFGRWVWTGLASLRALHSGRAIRRVVERELGGKAFKVPLRVGTLDLLTGQYKTFDEKDPNILDAVRASAAMPIISPPVRVGRHPWLIDGGIRNTSPIGDVLKERPDEIVTISCFPRDPRPLEKPPRTLVGIGARSYEIMANEIFLEDLKEFELINTLVRQADKGGLVLHHRPDKGERVLRSVRHIHIQPEVPLGDGLDFSGDEARRRLAAGRERAEKALG